MYSLILLNVRPPVYLSVYAKARDFINFSQSTGICHPFSYPLLHANSMDDDIWALSDEDNVEYDRAIAQKEWDRMHENHGNVSSLVLP